MIVHTLDWLSMDFLFTLVITNKEKPLKMLDLDKQIRPWTLESIFGDEVPNVLDYSNQPLLIVFFSLGCPSCLGRAIPYANRVVVENGDKMKVLGIHTDFHHNGYTLEQFQNAKDEFYIRFPFFRDAEYDKTFRDFGAGGTPHWILLDADGKVTYSLFGSDPNNALLKLDYKIEEILS